MLWYLANARRFRNEQDAVGALEAEVDWLEVTGWRIDPATLRLCADVDVVTENERFVLSVVYSVNFPFTPPSVVPRVPERLSDHQYGEHELCLEYGADNWHQELTGADMLQSAERLLRARVPGAKRPLSAVPSRHRTTLGQDLCNIFARLVVSPSLLKVLDAAPPGKTIRATFSALRHDKSYVVMPTRLGFDEAEPWVDRALPKQLEHFGTQWNGLAFSLPPGVDCPTPDTGRELKAFLENHGYARPEGYQPQGLEFILVFGGSQPRLFWMGMEDTLLTGATIMPDNEVRLSPEHAELAPKTVAIVGCGSVGSKIGVMLARSGVDSFLLVDDDILLPANLVRNDLDWSCVGAHKAEALAQRISLVAPHSTCTIRKQRLGGQEANGAADGVFTLLRGCDLIVDATADANVFNLLSAIAHEGRVAMVWAEVHAGGTSGLIARSRPGLDAEPQLVRARVEACCREKGVPAPKAAVDYARVVGDSPLIADDADVTVIAAHAARFCIDLLIKREPSWFPVSAYLIGLAPAWIFEQPFQTFPLDVGGPAAEEEEAVPEADSEHLKLIMQLITERGDAPSSAS